MSLEDLKKVVSMQEHVIRPCSANRQIEQLDKEMGSLDSAYLQLKGGYLVGTPFNDNLVKDFMAGYSA